MKLGTNTIASLKIGSTDISEVRLGSVLVWQNVTYLLDLYPALVAYSVRRLSSSYSGALIRVRRNSDQAEQDIGFTSGGELDTTSLASFVGGAIGFVSKIYNQGTGGATYDASQTSLVDQPLIYYSNTVFTYNGKPAIDFERFVIGALPVKGMNIANLVSLKTAFTVTKVATQNTINYILGNESPTQGLAVNGTFSVANSFGGYDSSGTFRGNSSGNLNRNLDYWNVKSGNLYASRNGNAESNLGSYLGNSFNLLYGRTAVSVVYFRGLAQETIMYNSDQTANKTAIETDINTYYGIY